MDGFDVVGVDDYSFGDFSTFMNDIQLNLEELSKECKTVVGKRKQVDDEQVLSFLNDIDMLIDNQQKKRHIKEYFIYSIYGKRIIQKNPVSRNDLSINEREVYDNIRKSLIMYPGRQERIFSMIQKYSKRLMSYFVVTYALVVKEISYYLDKSSYPFKVLGQYNNQNQPEILERIANGENIAWINLHKEYKNSTSKDGRKNCHAPYGRSESVMGEDGVVYSLSEQNFYIWLDSVGGFEVFKYFLEDIKSEKCKFDLETRNRRKVKDTFATNDLKKNTKHKTVLSKTNGQNYKTYIVKGNQPAPFFMPMVNKKRRRSDLQRTNEQIKNKK